LYTDLHHLFFEGEKILSFPLETQGKISHDVENLMAAFALCRHFKVSPETFLKGFSTFKKPAHRIEFVDAIDGVSYYDDSKGTNIDAVIRAVQTIDEKIVLIAGGVDKGAAYTPWIEVFQGKVKGIYAIGQAAGKIQEQMSHAIPVTHCQTLEEAVLSASKIALEGEAVLLSPGCSSFDMFRDYAHRGEEFQRIVKELKRCNV
jgi:UDP-N-acetylmuramoylalanine--D-glutamate ligase